jgi:hypothetical protein
VFSPILRVPNSNRGSNESSLEQERVISAESTETEDSEPSKKPAMSNEPESESSISGDLVRPQSWKDPNPDLLQVLGLQLF